MAYGQDHLAGALAYTPSGRGRSQSTTLRLPPISPSKKRASSYYPPTEPEIVDDTNPDPFYLEQSLSSRGPWGSCRQGMEATRYSHESQYYMLTTVNSGKELAFPAVPRGETAAARGRVLNNRSTLSVVELENQFGLQQTSGPSPWSGQACHSSQGSFSSVQSEATPDLTPSSSFSSHYSSPMYPDGAKPARHPFAAPYLPSTTPLNQTYTALPSRPSTPSREHLTPVAPNNASSDTLIMPHSDCDTASLRGKALPAMPPVPRIGNPPPGKRPSNPPARPPIEPSMISPPCRINPVTLEPHTTHFDQALFIPANDCPSPVPSPTPSPASPALERPSTSTKDRPSTSASEMYYGEQSVWESDSDNEDSDPKSLRKPIDTLKKVRSRVHLRVAKSTPKLQNQNQNNQSQSKDNSQELERFPSMPDRPPSEDLPPPPPPLPVVQARSSKDIFRPAATLRLVAPSTTSLVRPRTPRSRGNSCATTHQQSRPQTPKFDIDRSTAAAIQAQSRRRQRSDSPELKAPPPREKLCTLCREERSDRAIHQSLTLVRPPLYKRFWESLRVLGCHGDITPSRARKM